MSSFFTGYFMIFNFNSISEAVAWRYSVKKIFLKSFLNLQENTRVGVSFEINLQARGLQRN